MTWQNQNNGLEKDFHFKNFQQAMEFITRVAAIAEQMNHHPDIFLHDYNHVRLSITTHSQGTVTAKDYQLAEKIDAI